MLMPTYTYIFHTKRQLMLKAVVLMLVTVVLMLVAQVLMADSVTALLCCSIHLSHCTVFGSVQKGTILSITSNVQGDIKN